MGRLGRRVHGLRMVRGGVIPDRECGHTGMPLAQRLHEGGAVVLAAALAHQRHELARGGIEGAMHDTAGVASGEYDDLLLAPARLRCPQRRGRAPPGFLPQPPPPPPPRRRLPLAGPRLVLPETAGRAAPAP